MPYVIVFITAFLIGLAVGNPGQMNASAQIISEERLGPGEPKKVQNTPTTPSVPSPPVAPRKPPRVDIAPGYPRLTCWLPDSVSAPLIFEHPEWVFRPDSSGRPHMNSWTVWKRGSGNGESRDMIQTGQSSPEGDFVYLNQGIPCMYQTAPIQNNVRN